VVALPCGGALMFSEALSSLTANYAERYLPDVHAWTQLATLVSPLAVRLLDGRAFDVNAALLYDPATEVWSTTAAVPAFEGAAAVLSDGRVLALGFEPPSTAIYDPATQTWTSMAPPPYGFTTLVALKDGRAVS